MRGMTFALAVPALKGASGDEPRVRCSRQRLLLELFNGGLPPPRWRGGLRPPPWRAPPRPALPSYPLACPDRPLTRPLAPRPMWADAAAERPAYRFRPRQDR